MGFTAKSTEHAYNVKDAQKTSTARPKVIRQGLVAEFVPFLPDAYIALRYTSLHCITLHCIALHRIA